ncbi:MAG: hypothetical protein HQL25_05650 [Candidatus Omnitrophica bacterium]|nr:hypothetical protein [Candidatus Omnitrophota bacterium]
MRRNFLLCCFTVMFLSGCGTTLRTSPNYYQNVTQIKTLAVMPVDVEVFSLTAGNVRELRDDWSEKAKNDVDTALEKVLNGKYAWKIKFVDKDWIKANAYTTWRQNKALYEAVALSATLHGFNSQGQYSQSFKTKKDKFDYTLGSEIASLAKSVDADALLFVYGYDHEATAGRVASFWFNLMVGAVTGVTIVPTNPSLMTMGLINGETGDLEWYKTTPPASEYSFRNSKEIEKVMQWLGKDLYPVK